MNGTRAQEATALADVVRRYAAWVVVVVGALLCAVGVQVGVTTAAGLILSGIGTALVSAAVFAKITGLRSELADALIAEGVDDIFENRGIKFANEDWSRLVQSARMHYRVLGTANHGYLRNAPTAAQSAADFRAAVRRGVQIEILWLDPECDQAALRNAQEQRRDTIADTARSMVWFWELRESLEPKHQERLSLMEYDDLPTCGATWADDQLIISHYLAASLNLDSPGLVLRSPAVRMGRLRVRAGRTPPLTRLYEQHYEQVKSTAKALTEGRMTAIRAIEAARSSHASEADVQPGTAEADA